MGAVRIEIAVFQSTDQLIHNIEMLGFSYHIIGIFEDEYSGNERNGYKVFSTSFLSKAKYDYIIISFDHFKEKKQRLIEEYKIPAEKIYTFEEFRVKDSEDLITAKYHNRWDKIHASGINIFDQKTVVITGGSSGIGKECAHIFLAYGANVVIVGRNHDNLKAACQEYRHYGNIKYMLWDLTAFDQYPEKWMELQKKTNHQIDILIHSAGIFDQSSKDFFQVTESDFDFIIDTNLKVTYFLCQKFIRYFLEQRIKGHIVNLASNVGFLPTVKPYGLSKWGLVGFTKGLGMNFAQYGIVVNGVAPGEVATPMGKWKKGNCPARRAPKTGRVSFPCEVAEAVAYLAGDAGETMIGETLICNGGDEAINLKI